MKLTLALATALLCLGAAASLEERGFSSMYEAHQVMGNHFAQSKCANSEPMAAAKRKGGNNQPSAPNDFSCLCSFNPTIAQKYKFSKKWKLQKQSEGWKGWAGRPVNMDYYSVDLTGKEAAVWPVFEKVRKALDNPKSSSGAIQSLTWQHGFRAYSGATKNDNTDELCFAKPLSNTGESASCPVGAVMTIKLASTPWNSQAEGGSIVVTYQAKSKDVWYWVVSTVITDNDGMHPVAGNRMFGLYRHTGSANKWTFFTKGCDSVYPWYQAKAQQTLGVVFGGADDLWKKMTSEMAAYFNKNGAGPSSKQCKLSVRKDWDALKKSGFAMPAFKEIFQVVNNRAVRRNPSSLQPQTE